MPPDLSLISRVRGSDWIYTYLKSFYLDESRPLGWNNTLFPNASMPNPLWELQGLQHAEYGEARRRHRRTPGAKRLKVTQPGTLDATQFDQVARDITAFLEYAGEPAALKRQSLGVWVILFLAAFTFLAWCSRRNTGATCTERIDRGARSKGPLRMRGRGDCMAGDARLGSRGDRPQGVGGVVTTGGFRSAGEVDDGREPAYA